MYLNYDLSRAIERVLIRGDLLTARLLAESLATAPDLAGIENWTREATVIRTRAIDVAAAPGIDEACRRTARLFGACASCHAATGATTFTAATPAVPADKATRESRMARHRWAVDRVWEGVVGNADKPWRDGLDVLAATPVSFSPTDGDRVALSAGLAKLAESARADRATTASERARVYGELLVTCAACHSGASTTKR